MDFDYYYLGTLNEGRYAAVKVNQQAYVLLLDTANLHAYFRRRSYRHFGHLQQNREERYRIPYPAEWHLVVAVAPPATPIRSELRLPQAP